MVSLSHVTDLPCEDNVISLFPERSRATLRASCYSSEADDPFATPTPIPSSDQWYDDELATAQ